MDLQTTFGPILLLPLKFCHWITVILSPLIIKLQMKKLKFSNNLHKSQPLKNIDS